MSPEVDDGRQHRPEDGSEDGRGTVGSRLRDLVAWAQRVYQAAMRTRLGRAWTAYSTANGSLLARGIAFSALFSVFAAVAIGYTALIAVIGSNDRLRDQVLQAADDALPGLIDTGDGGGLLRPQDLVTSTSLSVTGLIALVVLVFSAVSAISALGSGVRAVSGWQAGANPVLGKLGELAGLASLLLSILLAAVVHLGVSAVGGWLLDLVGWSATPVSQAVLRVVALLLVFAVDTVTVLLILTVVSGTGIPWRSALSGAVVGAVGIGVLRQLGTAAVAGSVSNALLVPFAALVTLLLWVNLMTQVVLAAAAWAGQTATAAGHTPDRSGDGEAAGGDGGTGGPAAADDDGPGDQAVTADDAGGPATVGSAGRGGAQGGAQRG